MQQERDSVLLSSGVSQLPWANLSTCSRAMPRKALLVGKEH